MRDRQGDTALHLVASGHNLAIAKALLVHKADPNLVNQRDQTPLDEAHQQTMQKLLAEFGGHTGRELWPGEVRQGSNRRPAEFEGQSFEVRGFRIYPGGQYHFHSPEYELLLRNIDGQRTPNARYKATPGGSRS